MIWAAFSGFGKTTLAVVSTKMNSEQYQRVLQEHLKPHLHQFQSAQLVFMHDNAAIHRSKSTKTWFEDSGIPTLQWPTISPDANPIENVWGMISRRVYDNARQYNSVADLELAVHAAWDEIDQNTLNKLITSMPNRMKQMFKRDGGSIDY